MVAVLPFFSLPGFESSKNFDYIIASHPRWLSFNEKALALN